MRGPLFETWAVAEFVKYRANRALGPPLYFWRDSNGNEIDLVLDRGELLYPVEFKAGQTIAGDWFEPLRKFLGLAKGSEGALLYCSTAGKSDRCGRAWRFMAGPRSRPWLTGRSAQVLNEEQRGHTGPRTTP